VSGDAAGESGATPLAMRPPGLVSLVGAALSVGVAAGFLELAALAVQGRLAHRVGLGTLRISRHVAWMVPVAETLVTLGLALLFVAPALAWSARRAGRSEPARAVSRVWGWAGAVLGTLLFLGPLLAVRGLHAVGALALAIGAGTRLRHLVVRPTPAWQRASSWAGAIVLGGLPVYSLWQWHRVVHAEERAWSRPASRAPNLLWIVMDTVRADHTSLHGYRRPTTPQLEALARQGITFAMARSAAPWTLPSHVTMFTGLWPFEHGARIDRPYSGHAPTLAEHLRDHGYSTAGLAGNTGMCNATYGVGRGFDYYVELLCNHEVSLRATLLNSALGAGTLKVARSIGLPVAGEFQPTRRLAPELIAHAQEWLGRVCERNQAGTLDSRRPFFLFINFMDAHSPYLPLATLAREFWTEPVPGHRLAIPENGWRALQARDAAAADRRPELQRELDAVIRRLGDLYDDCLRGLDTELGRFLGDLRAAGMLEETWVVITSDHGEQFGEHNLFGHGTSLYNQQTHVPLILLPPLAATRTAEDPFAALRGLRIGVPVSHRDLPATVTGLLLPGAPNPFPGRSLARHWDADGPDTPDPILSQMEDQHLEGEEVQSDRVLRLDSMLAEDHLLIESSRKAPELYHLLEDPENLHNLAGRPAERARAERLKHALDALRRPTAGP
jgi:arylsulfatase A-like enzyme